jgi:hypothetical protein
MARHSTFDRSMVDGRWWPGGLVAVAVAGGHCRSSRMSRMSNLDFRGRRGVMG